MRDWFVVEGSVIAISNTEDESSRVNKGKCETLVGLRNDRQQLIDGWIEEKDKKDLVALDGVEWSETGKTRDSRGSFGLHK